MTSRGFQGAEYHCYTADVTCTYPVSLGLGERVQGSNWIRQGSCCPRHPVIPPEVKGVLGKFWGLQICSQFRCLDVYGWKDLFVLKNILPPTIMEVENGSLQDYVPLQ